MSAPVVTNAFYFSTVLFRGGAPAVSGHAICSHCPTQTLKHINILQGNCSLGYL